MASAWRHNIADKEILEEEFYDIVFLRNGKVTFEGFIIASGAYPSLREFAKALKIKADVR